MTGKLPSGTVTFLFTDIERSTKLAQQYPDAMPVLLARHNQILHEAIEGYKGYVFQVVGDSFAAAFHSASDALNAALDAQRNLQNESWTTLARLTIWSGGFSSPAAWLEEALSIARQVSDQTTEQYTLMIYGNLAYWQGNYREAYAYHKELFQLSERLGNHFTGLWAHVFKAYTLLRQGAIGQARKLFEECIQRAYKADWRLTWSLRSKA